MSKWTEEEDNIIRKYYPDGGSNEASKYLPGRFLTQIQNRARLLGVRKIDPHHNSGNANFGRKTMKVLG